jgi:hypothetical protein
MYEKRGLPMPVSYFQCRSCKKKAIVKNDTDTPSCCGKPMKKIPVDICLQPDQAEHARTMAEDEPCDDFRAGN